MNQNAFVRSARNWFALSAVSVLLLMLAVPAPLQAMPMAGSCQDVTLSVALAPGEVANKTIVGTYCTPANWAAGEHQVDVLVHGGTYNRTYWDWPVDASVYSYVDKTLGRGRATFAFDQIGAGQSSKPLSAAVTVESAAYVTHQAVQWVRGQGFGAVNLVGHSMGSFTAMREAGTYRDVDRLVITGALHVPGLGGGLLTGSLNLYPAALDAQFAGRGLDVGYVTTRPGTRGQTFYSPSADPTVVAYDDAHKDIISTVHVSTIVTDLTTPAGVNVSNQITAPVLIVMGQQDTLFCGLLVSCTQSSTVLANEVPYYTSAASVDTVTIANTGHNIALHPSASVSFQAITDWLETVGR